MNAWELPRSAVIGGIAYPINADYRDVLEIIEYLTDTSRNEYSRWTIALGLFFEGDIPEQHQEEAAKYLVDFIAYGTEGSRPVPKLIDWSQDSQMIVADINKVAGKEIRAEAFVHWWSFLAYFNAIGEGQLSTVVGIRSKKAKGKALDKAEQQYYREHREKVDFRAKKDPEREKVQEYFDKWL